jgi:hypothetical protein
MRSGFRWQKLVPVRDGTLTACVGVRRGSTFPLPAAIRHLATRRGCGEAFEGSEKQNRHHQANRDVKSTSHFGLSVARDMSMTSRSTAGTHCGPDAHYQTLLDFFPSAGNSEGARAHHLTIALRDGSAGRAITRQATAITLAHVRSGSRRFFVGGRTGRRGLRRSFGLPDTARP